MVEVARPGRSRLRRMPRSRESLIAAAPEEVTAPAAGRVIAVPFGVNAGAIQAGAADPAGPRSRPA